MIIEAFESGPVATNGYLVGDRRGGESVAIDAPQGVAVAMVEQAREWNSPIHFLINTHGHWDHIWDNAELIRLTGARFGIHRESAPLLTVQQTRMLASTPRSSRSHRTSSSKRAGRLSLAI